MIRFGRRIELTGSISCVVFFLMSFLRIKIISAGKSTLPRTISHTNLGSLNHNDISNL
jgi:hypothetical protein